jgi:DNA-directed RNA polymerase beta' subunit
MSSSSEICKNIDIYPKISKFKTSDKIIESLLNEFKKCVDYELQKIKSNIENNDTKIIISNIKNQNIEYIIDKNDMRIDDILENIAKISENLLVYKILTLIIHIFLILFSKKSYFWLILPFLLFFIHSDIKIECFLTIILIKNLKY